MKYPNTSNHFQSEHAKLINNSFKHLLLRDLIDNSVSDTDLARQIFHAPFAILSHNAEKDPFFNYANLKALELFELTWKEFLLLPSRLSAEPVNQAERDRLLALVTQYGYIDNYAGVRISSTGKRFMIKNAIVWNLTDNGIYKGQAACFTEWEFI
jgi:hypothetical protein